MAHRLLDWADNPDDRAPIRVEMPRQCSDTTLPEGLPHQNGEASLKANGV